MNGRDFILNTGFPPDKVLDTFSGSFVATSRYGSFSPRRSQVVHDNTAGDWCLINGAYTMDGTTWYPFGVGIAEISSGMPTFQTIEVNAYCDALQVVVQASNWTATTRTIQYALQIMARD